MDESTHGTDLMPGMIDAAMPDGIVLRRATPETIRVALSPAEAAFGERWTDEWWSHRKDAWDVDRIVAAYEGPVAVACAGAETLRLTVPGGEVAAAGLTLVGVRPTHRRRGLLRPIIRQQLDEYRSRGEPISILWASEGAIYQRFGYGLATVQASFDVERTRVAFLRPADALGRMRTVDVDEAFRLFPPLYETLRREVPGSLTRDETMWRLGLLWDEPSAAGEQGPKSLAVHERDGVPDGYVIYRLKPGWDARGPKGEVYVREVVGVTPAVQLEVWRWVLDLDLVGRITSDRLPVPPTLLLALAEPRRLGATIGDGIWLRILDLPAALEARRFAAPGILVLRVADAFCPGNAGTWRIEVGDPAPGEGPAGACRPGQVTAVEEGVAAGAAAVAVEPDIDLDVADLGAAYLGGVRFSDLLAADRVRELRPGAVRLADAMFASDRTPACATGF